MVMFVQNADIHIELVFPPMHVLQTYRFACGRHIISQSEISACQSKENKKLVVLAIEKQKRSISRMSGKVIEKANAKNLSDFMQTKIEPKASIKTDKWTGYTPLKSDFENLVQLDSGRKGDNFPEIHRAIMMFKSWLCGIYHRVTDLAYIDEYTVSTGI
jgi:hypothetical protein